MFRDQGGFFTVALIDLDLIISGIQIQGTKLLTALYVFETLLDVQEWVAVLDHDLIDVAIIDAPSDSAIFFSHENDGRFPLTM